MRFSTSVIFLAVTGINLASASLTIPRDITDGVYTLKRDATGAQILTRDEAHVSSAKFSRFTKIPRQTLPSQQIGCTSVGQQYAASDFETAQTNMLGFCDTGGQVSPSSAKIFYSGTAAAYVCSYGGSNPCSTAEWTDANSTMDGACGAGNGAYSWIGDWAKTYGRDVAGASICSGLEQEA